MHVFPGVPPAPGHLCYGEDRSIYRRGARRWRKMYKVNGHIFQAKRFNRKAFCAFCGDRIWGLGRQGFKCINCKMLIHKKCHKLCRVPCDVSLVCITKYKIEALKQNIHLLLKLEMYFIKDVNYELKPSLDINVNFPVSRPAA